VNKTLIVDGNSLLKLGFHGLKNFQNNSKHLGGVFFFLNTIRKSISEELFSKIIVAWDGEKNYTYRRKIYPLYKSKRREKRLNEEQKDSFYVQKVRVKQYLEEIFVRQCEFDGLEADDIIGYYTQNSKEDITILTNDRDLTQLINENVKLKLLSNNQIHTLKDNIKYEGFEIPVGNIKLLKIICGDSSDDISGIKNVGIKTVLKIMPEILEQNVNLKEFRNRCTKLSDSGDKNYRLLNILEGKTKEGLLGESFFDRNKKLIDLIGADYPSEIETEIYELINETLDPTGRSYKNLLKMMMEDGLFDFIGKSDESFLNFTRPFLLLSRVEKNKFKSN
jgi:5'-3' exonuclease